MSDIKLQGVISMLWVIAALAVELALGVLIVLVLRHLWRGVR